MKLNKSNLLSYPKGNNINKSGSDGGDMESRVAKLESDVEYIKRDVADIKGDLKDHRKEVFAEFKEIREDLKEFKRDMNEFKTETAKEFGKVRTEMHSIARQIIMWNVGSMFTAVGIVFALLRYLATNTPT